MKLKFLIILSMFVILSVPAMAAIEVQADVNNDGIKENIVINADRIEVNDKNGGSITEFPTNLENLDKVSTKIITNKKGQIIIIKSNLSSIKPHLLGQKEYSKSNALMVIGYFTNKIDKLDLPISYEYKVQDIDNDGNYEIVYYLNAVSDGKQNQISYNIENYFHTNKLSHWDIPYTLDDTRGSSGVSNIWILGEPSPEAYMGNVLLLPYIYNVQKQTTESLDSQIYKTTIGKEYLNEWNAKAGVVWGYFLQHKSEQANRIKDIILDVNDIYLSKEKMTQLRQKFSEIETR